MKFLCVPCDSPMKLQSVGPPERGSLSVVYSCPECGYEMAMLTNAYETQVVQSLGVRIGPAEASARSGHPLPVHRNDSGDGRGETRLRRGFGGQARSGRGPRRADFARRGGGRGSSPVDSRR